MYINYKDYFKKQYKTSFTLKVIKNQKKFLYRQFKLINKKLNLSAYKDKNVLEIGSGLGALASLLLEFGFKNYQGIELDKDAVEFTNRTIGNYFKNIKLEDLKNCTKKYDLIFALETLEHLESPLYACKIIFDLLNENGIFIGTSPYPFLKNILCDRTHLFVLHPKNWEKIFYLNNFKKVETYPLTFLPCIWRLNKHFNIRLPFYLSFKYFISTSLIIAYKSDYKGFKNRYKGVLKIIKDNLLIGIRAFFYLLFYKLRLSTKKIFKRNKLPLVDVRIKDINFKVRVNLKEEGLPNELFLCGIREYPNALYFIDFIKKHKDEINTIIDIGANIGYYVLFADKILKRYKNKITDIFALEPVKSNFELLNKNISLNNARNIKAINAAVGEDDKRVAMAVPKAKNLSHIEGTVKTIKAAKNYKKESVNMISLKTLFSRYNISKRGVMFRSDIEGYEYQVLKGNKELFKSLERAFIVMEFHPFLLKKDEVVDFLNILKEVGFRLDFVVSCYPLYFLCAPKPIRGFLKKNWVWEKENDPLGLIKRIKTIEDLISEVSDTNSPIYNHPNLHLYLIKS